MKIVAVIPVKNISERVKNKIFRGFYKNSSLIFLISKLKNVKIYLKFIFSNSELVKKFL